MKGQYEYTVDNFYEEASLSKLLLVVNGEYTSNENTLYPSYQKLHTARKLLK